LVADGPQGRLDVDVETRFHPLKPPEHSHEIGSGQLRIVNRFNQDARVVARETRTAEWASAWGIRVRADLRQEKRPITGVAMRF
jgi:hypothetical protein